MRHPFRCTTALAIIGAVLQFSLGTTAIHAQGTVPTQEEQRRSAGYISRRTAYTAAAALAGVGVGTAVVMTNGKKGPGDSPVSGGPPGPQEPRKAQEIQEVQDEKEDQKDPGPPFQLPTKLGTLEFRFRTIGTPDGNSGFWRGVVIQPGQAASATAPISTEAITSISAVQLNFGPTVRIGDWTVIIQLEPGSEVSARALQVQVLADGMLYQEFCNTNAMDRPRGAPNDEQSSEGFCIVCDGPLGPPEDATGSP
jgi:hypothetical protein